MDRFILTRLSKSFDKSQVKVKVLTLKKMIASDHDHYDLN